VMSYKPGRDGKGRARVVDQGFFKVPNDIMGSGLFRKPYTPGEALLDLYAQRSWNINGHMVDLAEGDVTISARGTAERWGWSKSAVHRFMKARVADGVLLEKRYGKRDGQVSVFNLPIRLFADALDERLGRRAGQSRDTSGTLAGHCSRRSDDKTTRR
jgi:hypothetical protein